jgi:ribosomal protein L11 methylase PrmA
MTAVLFDPASYRDRRGRVFEHQGRIFRLLSAEAAEDLAWLEGEGMLADLIADGRLVRSWRAEVGPEIRNGFHAAAVLEHERLAFISYPYEWPFTALKTAALFHLDLHRDALKRGASLAEASAYNVQFVGARPVFIDVLSLRRYRDGEYWLGHQQFLDQFLNPLLLCARLGIGAQAMYRGSPEGIATSVLARLLCFHHKLSPRLFLNVVLPAWLQRLAARKTLDAAQAVRRRPLPKRSYVALLASLRRMIEALKARSAPASAWSDYASEHSYAAVEMDSKRRFITDYAARTQPRLLVDLGCNTGIYTAAALAAGAASAIGIEADADAADQAFRRAAADRLAFLPLVMDAADLSPGQGWRGLERQSFATRARFDGMMALAFTHHLAIGRNIPLDQLVEFLVGLAPNGVIEFVPKSDPQLQRLLRLREDIFGDYDAENFAALLARSARIVRQETVSASGRVLYWYDRSSGGAS